MTDNTNLEITTSWGSDRRLDVSIANGEARHADRLNPQSARSRTQFLKGLRDAIPGLKEAECREIDQRLVAMAAEGPPTKGVTADPTDDDLLARRDELVESRLGETPPETRAAAIDMLCDPGLTRRILGDTQDLGVAGEDALVLQLYLLGTSRLTSGPLAACVQGTSSSGKSFVIDKVASLMPDESVLRATDMTANALYYLEPGGLMHRHVVAGERTRRQTDDAADRTRALREMISAGELRKMLPEKVGDTIQTRVIRSPGPIAYVESTTAPTFFNEDSNRMLLLGTDDSPEQTKRILMDAANRADGSAACADADQIIAVHHTAQRLLRRVEVRVPFAGILLDAMPSALPEARRAAGLVLGAVRACALLHQYQRGDEDLEHGDQIDAKCEDYEIVRPLLLGPLSRMLGGGLPLHTQAFGTWLLSATQAGVEFRAPSGLLGLEGCRWGDSQLREHLRRLLAAGVIERKRKGYYRICGPLPESGAVWLPDPEILL